MNDITKFIIILILLIIFDLLWQSFAYPSLYAPTIVNIQKENVNMGFKFIGVIFAWILLALGITYLVMPLSKTHSQAFLYGALLGLIIYGVYNGVNFALFTQYDFRVLLFDILWGTFLCGFVSFLAFSANAIF